MFEAGAGAVEGDSLPLKRSGRGAMVVRGAAVETRIIRQSVDASLTNWSDRSTAWFVDIESGGFCSC